MSLLLTVPNDDSGILSVIPSAPFISKAVRATGSLLVSFAGGVPWIPGEHRRGIGAVECVAAHLRV